MNLTHINQRKHTVYIGRPSIFGNPYGHKPSKYKVEFCLTAKEAVEKYETWVRTQPEILKEIKNLPEDSILGCFCGTGLDSFPCHGNIIIKLWEELNGRKHTLTKLK